MFKKQEEHNNGMTEKPERLGYTSFWQRLKKATWFKPVALLIITAFLYQDVVWAFNANGFIPNTVLQQPRMPVSSPLGELANLMLPSEVIAYEVYPDYTYESDLDISYNNYTPSVPQSASTTYTNTQITTAPSTASVSNMSGVQVPSVSPTPQQLDISSYNTFAPAGFVHYKAGNPVDAVYFGMTLDAGSSSAYFPFQNAGGTAVPITHNISNNEFYGNNYTPVSNYNSITSGVLPDLATSQTIPGNAMSLHNTPVTFNWETQAGTQTATYRWQDLGEHPAHLGFNSRLGGLGFNAYVTPQSANVGQQVQLGWNLPQYNKTFQAPSDTTAALSTVQPNPSHASMASIAGTPNALLTLKHPTDSLYFTNAGLTFQAGDTWRIDKQTTIHGLGSDSLTVATGSTAGSVVMNSNQIMTPLNIQVSKAQGAAGFNYYAQYHQQHGTRYNDITATMPLTSAAWNIQFDKNAAPYRDHLRSALKTDSGTLGTISSITSTGAKRRASIIGLGADSKGFTSELHGKGNLVMFNRLPPDGEGSDSPAYSRSVIEMENLGCL